MAESYTTRLDDALSWARKYSLFSYPFVTACCGMEYMATAASKYDIARFGAEFPRFSPRQADLLFVVGTITERQAPVLHRIWMQMAEPKYVIAFGVCASTGGFYQNYNTVPGCTFLAARPDRNKCSTGSSSFRRRFRMRPPGCSVVTAKNWSCRHSPPTVASGCQWSRKVRPSLSCGSKGRCWNEQG